MTKSEIKTAIRKAGYLATDELVDEVEVLHKMALTSQLIKSAFHRLEKSKAKSKAAGDTQEPAATETEQGKADASKAQVATATAVVTEQPDATSADSTAVKAKK